MRTVLRRPGFEKITLGKGLVTAGLSLSELI